MLTAIETSYAGCRFRSRLEARWAVLFDALGVRWEYEPQGFALPSGPYLPDFRLHLQSRRDNSAGLPETRPIWFEVKPDLAKIDPRWSELAKVANTSVVVTNGMRLYRPGTSTVAPSSFEIYFSDGWDEDYRFCICATCRAVGIEFDGRAARLCLCLGESQDKGYNYDDPVLERAYARALSARFEFGESG